VEKLSKKDIVFGQELLILLRAAKIKGVFKKRNCKMTKWHYGKELMWNTVVES